MLTKRDLLRSGALAAITVAATKPGLVYAQTTAKGGIYGNDAVEATYPFTRIDAKGEPLDGSKHNYTITFPTGQLPPVKCLLVGDDV
jgi:hypothetical protein